MKSLSRVFNILGPALALADSLGLLDLFFLVKERLRIKVRLAKDGAEMLFLVDNREELFRSKQILTKEPGTIAWIDSSFKPGETFFDIGANIGGFSMYAAKRVRGLRIFSFEPHFHNFAKLNENIVLNGLKETITAFPLALSDEDSILTLSLNNISSGFTGHQYGGELDQRGVRFEPVLKQGCAGFSLDSLVQRYGFPVPNHIKIDVDGSEMRIISGAKKVLGDPALRTILIELNIGEGIDPEKERESRSIIATLQSEYGFKVSQVARVGNVSFPHNYVFVR